MLTGLAGRGLLLATLGLSVGAALATSACTVTSTSSSADGGGGGTTEPGSDGGTSTPSEAGSDGGAGDDAGGTGACTVSAVPANVRTSFSLAPFYTKYVGVSGFPIVASSKVPDAALCTAHDVVVKMLAFRPEIFGRMAEKKIRLAVMAQTELTTDIPEHSDLTPKEYWDQRARGLGATLARPAVSCAEENVLCYGDDVYKGESILVHEFAHAIFMMGVALFEPTMQTRLDQAYADAMSAGRFANTYAAENADEYFAEGVQDWFDTNITVDPPNGIHGPIHTRAQLKAYDPALATLIAEIFGDTAWRYACPAK